MSGGGNCDPGGPPRNSVINPEIIIINIIIIPEDVFLTFCPEQKRSLCVMLSSFSDLAELRASSFHTKNETQVPNKRASRSL
jgi:hypothetical protein